MEPEPTTARNEAVNAASLDTAYATKLASQQVSSPLANVLNEHNEQLAKLGELVAQLADKLAPLRNIMPQPVDDSDKEMVSNSPIVGDILRRTADIKYLQMRINEMLQDLEV